MEGWPRTGCLEKVHQNWVLSQDVIAEEKFGTRVPAPPMACSKDTLVGVRLLVYLRSRLLSA